MSDHPQDVGGQQPTQKPGAVTAFGVLNIVFGALSLIVSGIVGLVTAFASRFMNEGMGMLGELARETGSEREVEEMNRFLEESGVGGAVNAAFTSGLIFSILAILLNAFLLAAGIMLLKNSKAAIAANRLYGFIAIALVVVQIIVNAAIGLGIGWFGAIIGLVYPILVLALVAYNKSVKQYFEAVS